MALEEVDLGRFGYEQELRRGLRLRDLIIYGMIIMAPMAPMPLFGPVFAESHGMTALVYIVGGVAMTFTAISYQQMSRAYPVAGSVYSYAGRAISPVVGFLAGWGILLDYLLVPSVLYVVAAQSMADIVPGLPSWVWIIVFVVVNTVINLRGITVTATANKVFLVLALLIVAAFVILSVIAVSRGVGGAHWSGRPFYDHAGFSSGFVFAALPLAVPAYFGFDAISTMAEETRGGDRAVGRATVLSLGLMTALFVAQSYLGALLVPRDTDLTNADATNNIFFAVSQAAGGHVFRVVVATAVALSAGIATALVGQTATARLLFSMARDGQLPRFLRYVDPVRKTPQRAILLLAGLSVVLGLLFVSRLGLLVSLLSFGGLFAFLMLHVSVVSHYLIRRRQRTWFIHLVVPALGFAIIAFVLIKADSNAQIGGLIWLAIGVVLAVVLSVTGRTSRLKLPDA